MVSATRGTVVVLGGGVIGMAIALELAPTHSCTLVDPAPGRGASWAAAGLLSPAAEVAPGEEGLLGDLVAAAACWPAFADHVGATGGLDVGYEASGSVLVGLRQGDVREAVRFAALARSFGIDLEPLSSDELADLEPSLVSGLRGGWLLPEDHRVDNRRLVDALLAALKAQGVSILEDTCVALEAHGVDVRCVLEHQGTLAADRVVIATGASRALPGLEELGLPAVRPVRGSTLRLTAVAGVAMPCRSVRAIVDGVHCYLVPRGDGALVVGATVEEQGYAALTRTGGVHQLLDAAREVFPGVDELSFDEAATGLRPATDDHVPFVGALRDPRVVAAVGHYRNGILLAPLTARRVAALLGAG